MKGASAAIRINHLILAEIGHAYPACKEQHASQIFYCAVLGSLGVRNMEDDPIWELCCSLGEYLGQLESEADDPSVLGLLQSLGMVLGGVHSSQMTGNDTFTTIVTRVKAGRLVITAEKRGIIGPQATLPEPDPSFRMN